VFVPRQLNSHGSGCAISLTARWCDGSTDAWGRRVRKVLIVALARRLLIALWRYTTQDVLPQDALLKVAA
jgi:transposase